MGIKLLSVSNSDEDVPRKPHYDASWTMLDKPPRRGYTDPIFHQTGFHT